MSGRIVIIGAGPAGIRAAQTLVAAGQHPTVIDEAPRAGGQIYRRPSAEFTRSGHSLYGTEASKAGDLHRTFDAMLRSNQLTHMPESTVMAVRDKTLFVLGGEGVIQQDFDRLILATGAGDRIAPVPGWQAPGVYALGAAQIALKAQGIALGRNSVLAGSGPLLTLVAVQLLEAGARVEAVLDTASVAQQARGLAGIMARPRLALRGIGMRARLRGLYHAGARLDRIEAGPEGVIGVQWRDKRGRAQMTSCDTVAMGWHLRAETHLADLLGCTFQYSAAWQQWLPCVDDMGRGPDGVYLAGDGVRLLGADGAEIAGRLSAIACLRDMALPAPDPAADQRALARISRFANGLARAFPWPGDMVRALADDTVICRCEGVRVADLRQAVDHGGAEVNRVKSLARIGMGRCQGRYCQLAATELIAAHAGCAHADVGRLRAQAPTRATPIGALMKGLPPEG